MSKVLLELLQEYEREDGVRAEPDEGRHVALVERQRALAEGEADQVERACNHKEVDRVFCGGTMGVIHMRITPSKMTSSEQHGQQMVALVGTKLSMCLKPSELK